jgi:molecular chaperone DnaJ
LKRAFRKLARQYHPDVNKSPDAHKHFQEINEAYQVLSNEQQRAAYDRFGHAGVNGAAAGAGGFGGFTNMDDLFSDIFNVFTGGMRASRRSGPRQGMDLRYDLNLSFEQAVFGDDVEINISRRETCSVCNGSRAEPGSSPHTCPECNGSGQVRQARQTFLGSIVNVMDCPRCHGLGEVVDDPCHHCRGTGYETVDVDLNVHVPPGVDDGLQIRLSGEGEPGERGGPRGNLYVVLHVEPHEFFQRRGNDILLDMPINVAQAVLGDRVTVPTVDGDEEIDIQPGTQSGAVVRLKNKGVPRLRRDGTTVGRGDQLVILNVEIPKKLNQRQRELFEELAETMGTDLKPNKSGKGFLERVANLFSSEQ